MGLGMTAVIITGGIDLSVGSVLCLAGMVTGMSMAAETSIWLAVPAGLLAAVLVGGISGFLIAYVGMAAGGKAKPTPMPDRRVRQAINHAINRKAIVDAFVGGASQVINAACNPKQFGCISDVTAYAYDPEKAKALLAEAGHGAGFQLG